MMAFNDQIETLIEDSISFLFVGRRFISCRKMLKGVPRHSSVQTALLCHIKNMLAGCLMAIASSLDGQQLLTLIQSHIV